MLKKKFNLLNKYNTFVTLQLNAAKHLYSLIITKIDDSSSAGNPSSYYIFRNLLLKRYQALHRLMDNGSDHLVGPHRHDTHASIGKTGTTYQAVSSDTTSIRRNYTHKDNVTRSYRARVLVLFRLSSVNAFRQQLKCLN